tara:strand:- start:271 stop:567 length:297 start_codon:yes stop_codon:yes gene_type:complete
MFSKCLSSFVLLCFLPLLISCKTTTKPEVDYSSKNVISFRYHGFNMGPTLTAEVRDLAAIHCQKYGRTAVYGGVETVGITTEEVHTFSCESGSVTVNK